ncbi:hypothetical protein [Lichenihabitans psoromatis]|uniref:hypothetical protein n=1 Tax=Lichenihabitans psoromatis TaxID=2528642 RepID=UPI001035B7AB|nr:hypothetical protein [Lichenihabitans psoromatis]
MRRTDGLVTIAVALVWFALDVSIARAEIPLPGKLAGAFVAWGPEGRESNMALWEARLNRPLSSVPALDYFGKSTWDSFGETAFLPALWKAANPTRRMVWSVPLTMKGTPLSDVAAGLHDPEFRQAAMAIAAAQPSAVIRFGWEMNDKQTAWFAGPDPQAYVAAFRHVVALFRAVSPRFRFDWCPSWGAQDMAADLAYPGDDVVDTIGLDVYDYADHKSPEARWTASVLEAPFGLTWQRDFAQRHGKDMSYAEWGVGQAGDNPSFVQHMTDWFRQNQAHIAFAIYFDIAGGAWPSQIDDGTFPRSQALFMRLYALP